MCDLEQEPRDAQEILDDLLNEGTGATPAELKAVCETALHAELAAATLDEIEASLRKAGWVVVDMTTDDDDLPVVQLVAPSTENLRDRIKELEAALEAASEQLRSAGLL